MPTIETGDLRVGVIIMPTDFGADPRDVARVLEDRGFESYFFPEHTHIPWSRESPFPIGTDLPRVYWRNLDPLVCMGAAISVTERLRFGTGICLLAQREPILTAKTLATLDHLSGGRIEIGVGAGWNLEEMRHHGVIPERRWSFVREHALAMKEIWRSDHATFQGEFVHFEDIASWPKPAQTGGVPILIGGDTKYTVSRIAGYGDGWIPVLDGDLDGLLARIAEVGRALEEREAEPVPVSVAYGYNREVRDGELERLEDAGVHRIILAVDGMPYDETVAAIDAHADLVRQWLHP
jgi:probable F420-dependent oxidoreductase